MRGEKERRLIFILRHKGQYFSNVLGVNLISGPSKTQYASAMADRKVFFGTERKTSSVFTFPTCLFGCCVQSVFKDNI